MYLLFLDSGHGAVKKQKTVCVYLLISCDTKHNIPTSV